MVLVVPKYVYSLEEIFFQKLTRKFFQNGFLDSELPPDRFPLLPVTYDETQNEIMTKRVTSCSTRDVEVTPLSRYDGESYSLRMDQFNCYCLV